MSLRMENTHRSNHSIFLPQNFGSPFNDAAEHISGLGLARLDFERSQDEEARIATLAHALKKLGNREDAAEFMRCLNAICSAQKPAVSTRGASAMKRGSCRQIAYGSDAL
jgi:hypothetical protein